MGRARKLGRAGQQWTPRQREVLEMLARGRTNPEIAGALGITLDGAKYHVREILAELGVETREDAAEYWRAENKKPARLKRGLGNLALMPAVRWGLLATTGTALAVGGLAFLFLARDDAAGNPPEIGLVFQIEPVSGEPYLLTVSAADGHELGRAPQDTFAEATAGRFVLLQSQTGIDAMEIDGSNRRRLYSPTSGKVVIGVSPSPEGSGIAVLERVETGGNDSVVLLDMDTGGELARFNRDDPRFEGFLGGFQEVLWHRHDDGLTIGSGGVQVEGDHEFRQSFAYVDLDGKVTVTVVDASAAVAPDGERVLEGSPATPGCMGFVSTHELRLVALASGKVLNLARDPERGLRADISINADRPIYRALADASCSPADQSTTTWELPPSGQPIQQSVEPYDQLKASRPKLDIEVSCGPSQPAPWGDGGYSPFAVRSGGGCRPISVPMGYTPTPGNEQRKLYIRGRLIAEMTNFLFIGVVTLPRP